MPAQSRQLQALRRDPASKVIARAWRSLTGGGRGRDAERRTLLACSGGADSSALVLALAAHAQSPSALMVAHVVHDMRTRREALAERDRVRTLAAQAGLEFVESAVKVRAAKGNTEGVARDRRYAALAGMATQARCSFVATGHQGDDLVETMLMRLVRGTGVRGLVGIHESRPLTPGVTLIRPLLGITRADAERLCDLAAWSPNHDPTNLDTSRLRARVRHDVLPVLRDVSPALHERLLETSRLMASVAEVLDAQVSMQTEGGQAAGVGVAAGAGVEGAVTGHSFTIPRARARSVPPVILAEVLRSAVARAGGPLDRLPARSLAEACRVIQSASTDPKTIRLPGLTVRVTAREVACRAAPPSV